MPRIASSHTRNLHVAESGKFETFRTIRERQQFYLWFYQRAMIERGHQIRWPLAAALVAYQVHLCNSVENVVTFGYSSDTLRAFLHRANQCIFDDVLPKLQDLWIINQSMSAGPLTGQSAIDWDAKLLSEEQNLIQPLYDGLSRDDLKRLRILASQTGPAIVVGSRLYDRTLRRVLTGPGRIVKAVRPFDGDLLSASQRWRYGMTLAAGASNLTVDGRIPVRMPTPAHEYLDGTALKNVDTHPRLHMFDALIEGANRATTSSRIANLMQTFTLFEQRAFLSDHRFRVMARKAGMPWAELRRGVAAFTVDLRAQLELLDTFPGQNWHSLTSYSDIRPMIIEAPHDQKSLVRGDRWRNVFAAVCDDTTILTAVDDLGIENSERKEWINTRRRLLI